MNVTAGDIDRFREMITAATGLHFGHDASEHLAGVLRARLRESGCASFDRYWALLRSRREGAAEIGRIAAELTVPETYFFRHPEQYAAFTRVALPDLLNNRRQPGPLRVLSAGCASGEEAYSIAALAADLIGPDAARRVEVVGIDINAALIRKAEEARYAEWSLRATPDEQRRRFFRPDGRQLVVRDDIRAMVRFEQRNLLGEDDGFWQRGSFDAVFCRNVMIYLSPEAMKALIARISGSLCEAGYLFLGPSETLRGVSQDFHLCHTHGAFYYQRRDVAAHSRAPSPVALSFPPIPQQADRAPVAADEAWFGEIGQASRRITTLVERARSQAAPGGPRRGRVDPLPQSAPVSRWDLGAATELLRQERFSEVLQALRALPAESESDPDALILRAVVLTNGGNTREAEVVCLKVLALDEMNAGAHYLCALCREHAGDLKAAAEHDETAVYLDPGFSMPRLHLGLMAARAGDFAAARRELSRALELLSQEDAARVLLFGGGFQRESLMQLCRAKLAACGATV